MIPKWVVLTAAGWASIGCGVGLAIGYYVAKRQLEADYDHRVEEEVKSARKYYSRLAKKEEFSDPTEIVENLHNDEIIEKEHYAPAPVITEDEDAKYKHFDYRREMPQRTSRIGYVISLDEFRENPKDFDQQTISYYPDDDVLADDHNSPIDDHGILGPVALEQFGNGSHDPNIVYVRNEWLAIDFEVLREDGSFEESVLGAIKHSAHHKIRKFRIDDD